MHMHMHVHMHVHVHVHMGVHMGMPMHGLHGAQPYASTAMTRPGVDGVTRHYDVTCQARTRPTPSGASRRRGRRTRSRRRGARGVGVGAGGILGETLRWGYQVASTIGRRGYVRLRGAAPGIAVDDPCYPALVALCSVGGRPPAAPGRLLGRPARLLQYVACGLAHRLPCSGWWRKGWEPHGRSCESHGESTRQLRARVLGSGCKGVQRGLGHGVPTPRDAG